MLRLLTLLTFLLLTNGLFAQATFSGQIRDANSRRPIAKVDIRLLNSQLHGQSNPQGQFTLQVLRNGRYKVNIDKRGYNPQEVEVHIHPGCASLTVWLEPKLLGTQIWESWTPTLSEHTPKLSDTLVEQKLGNQELTEVIRQLPGAYASRQGGGWGDSRLQLHGFTEQEVAYTLNGVPLNDPENGQFYWSRWSVLRHLEPQISYTPGTGQSLLTTEGIGGELRILSRGVEVNPTRSFTLSRGNDNFQSYRLNWQHGLGWSQWGLTAMVAHDRGNGYVDGTEFQSFSYFLSLEKRLNAKHRFTITALGSSQWHHQRTLAGGLDQITLRTFVDPDGTTENTNLGRRYNHEWGFLDGETFSARRDFYSQPLYSLNHLWQPKRKLRINTLAYGSHGRGGETGLRGRIRTGRASLGDSFDGFGTGIYDSLGQIRFDDLMAYNQGIEINDFGEVKPLTADGQYIVSRNGLIDNTQAGSGFVRRASINNTDQYGLASRAIYSMSKGLQFSLGIDYRAFRSQHFRRVENLLGAGGYLAQGDINTPAKLVADATPATFGNFGADAQAMANNVINYNYRGQIQTLGLLGRIDYRRHNWHFYGQLNQGQRQLTRIDYFNYDPTDSPDNDLENDAEYHQSPVQEYRYHNYQFGFSYQLGKGQGISGQLGQLSRAPLFDEVFEGNRNRINTVPSAQIARNWQLNYAIRKASWAVRLQVYQQQWSGRVTQQGLSNYAYDYLGDTLRVNALARFEDLKQLHEGINLDFTFGLNRSLQLNGRVGLGDWRFPEDQTAVVTDLDNERVANKITAETAELPIGNAAQTTLSLGLQWEVRPGLRLGVDYLYFDRLYAPWQISASVPEEIVQLPSFSLIDLYLRYNFLLGKRTNTTLFFQMNNLRDETYVAELTTNIADDPATANRNEFYHNQGIFGLGRTWNAGLSVDF